MNPLHSRVAVLVFTLAYIGLCAVYLISTGNVEFTRYLIVLILAVAFFVFFRNEIALPAWIFWLISIVGLTHLLGGLVRIGGDVLYAYVPFGIPNAFGLTILKYDQIIHAFSSGVGAIVVYAFLKDCGLKRYVLALVTFLAALGIGSINEIIEFWVSLTVPGNGVGGYYNNSLDLVFNALGSFAATVGVMLWWKHEGKIKKS